MNHEILDNLALFYDAIEKSNIDKQNNFFKWILILFVLTFITIIIIQYINNKNIKQLGKMYTKNNNFNPPLQNYSYPQLQNYSYPQLQNYNRYPQLQNYQTPRLSYYPQPIVEEYD